MKNKFYITTPIYYANAKPHIGHAYTTIAADVLTRFHKLQNEEVFFLTGMDEHGAKIQKAAEAQGKDPQKFVDEIGEEFKDLWQKLNIKFDNFIRTTDPKHKEAVQKVLQALYDKGAIYKGEYEGLYCTGCEQFKNENELVDGKCPDHNAIPENMREECYLMKMTELQPKLIEKIEKDEFKIAPERYKNEVLSFLKSQELKDISISRKNLKWGVPLPFDSEHTTYVWVDAFLNYLTGLGWDGDANNIPKQWPADVQLIGKDILRVHATIWPAILLHLGIELPKMLFTHGHILSGGKKMSKTLGNVITIDEMLEKFGTDGARYLLMTSGVFGNDGDITMERMTEKFNADLANGLGNLVSRVVKLSEKMTEEISLDSFVSSDQSFFNDLKFDLILESVMEDVKNANKKIEDTKPWDLVKGDKNNFNKVIADLMVKIYSIAERISFFMPETSEKIKQAIRDKETSVLFQRIK